MSKHIQDRIKALQRENKIARTALEKIKYTYGRDAIGIAEDSLYEMMQIETASKPNG